MKRDTTGAAAPAISTSGDNPFGTGFWVARFDPNTLPRTRCEIYHMATRGPAGCALQIFVDAEFVSGTSKGSLNEWDSNEPITYEPGQSVIAYWNTANTPAPYLALYLRPVGG